MICQTYTIKEIYSHHTINIGSNHLSASIVCLFFCVYVHQVIYRPFYILVYVIISILRINRRNTFIWLVLYFLHRSLICRYRQNIQNQCFVLWFKPNISTICFPFNQSYSYYYLLLCFFYLTLLAISNSNFDYILL